jgi:hypothetical protein
MEYLLANEGPVNADLLAFQGSVYVALLSSRGSVNGVHIHKTAHTRRSVDDVPNVHLRDASSRLFLTRQRRPCSSIEDRSMALPPWSTAYMLVGEKVGPADGVPLA